MKRKFTLIFAVLMAFCLGSLTGCSLFGQNKTVSSPILVAVTPGSAVLRVGETLQLEVATSVAGKEDELFYYSDDDTVASVDDSGLVTAVGVGSTEIFVSSPNDSKSCSVTVMEKAEESGVTLSPHSLALVVGGTATVTAVTEDGSSVTWRTENAQVATVQGGVVTAAGAGRTRIVAESKTAGTGYCEVTVTPSEVVTPTITVSPTAISLRVGASQRLSATTTDSSPVTWRSQDEGVAEVDQSGEVTAVGAGTTRVIATSATAGSAECTVTVSAPAPKQYRLVWQDEFDGGRLDDTDWEYQEGIRDVYHGVDSQNWNWGNQELQYYTRDAVSFEGDYLVITARRQQREGMDFTSARIATRDRHAFTYGYFEAKMKLPVGNGMWPAFWMLPQPTSYSSTNNQYGGWPANGEIDIMEAKGRLSDRVGTTLHFGPAQAGDWRSQWISKDTVLSSPIDEWHTYGLEWTEDKIVFLVDREPVLTVSSSQWFSRNAPYSTTAPFDVDFYILINLAVGGNFDGGVRPDDSFTSASMYVDYVRVYQMV